MSTGRSPTPLRSKPKGRSPTPLRSRPKLKVQSINIVHCGEVSGNAIIAPGGTIHNGICSRLFDMLRFPKFDLSHPRVLPGPLAGNAPSAGHALPARHFMRALPALPSPEIPLRESKLSYFLVAGGLVAAFAVGYASGYARAKKRFGGLTEEPPAFCFVSYFNFSTNLQRSMKNKRAEHMPANEKCGQFYQFRALPKAGPTQI